MTPEPGSQPSAPDRFSDQSYEALVAAGLQAPFAGWNFDYLNTRVRDCVLPWSYEDLARTEIANATKVLDLNTCGGELLATLVQGLGSVVVVATESWPPNVPVARQLLGPLGVELRPSRDGSALPAAGGEFGLVLNRHGAADPDELRRVLHVGGTYFMQRVGRSNDTELNTALGGPAPGYRETVTLDHDATELTGAGLEVLDSGEAFAEYGFLDIGAVVYNLTAVPWQVPGFDVSSYDKPLRQLDKQIRRQGEFVVRHHRYFIRARRT